jgi:hypothetical protein
MQNGLKAEKKGMKINKQCLLALESKHFQKNYRMGQHNVLDANCKGISVERALPLCKAGCPTTSDKIRKSESGLHHKYGKTTMPGKLMKK